MGETRRWYGWRNWWLGKRIEFLTWVLRRCDDDELRFVIEVARLRLGEWW
jgi:hypothetical protein